MYSSFIKFNAAVDFDSTFRGAFSNSIFDCPCDSTAPAIPVKIIAQIKMIENKLIAIGF